MTKISAWEGEAPENVDTQNGVPKSLVGRSCQGKGSAGQFEATGSNWNHRVLNLGHPSFERQVLHREIHCFRMDRNVTGEQSPKHR
jgi:hypothetical protein